MNGHLKSTYLSLFLAMLGLVAGAGGVLAQAGEPALSWHYELTDGAASGLGISGDGETLVAVIGFGFDPGGQIVSLDPANGEVRWHVDTPEGASADPSVVDGVVYAGMGSLVGG